MYTAKKDFSLGSNRFKKGNDVRVSDSIAKKLKDEDKIKDKTEKKIEK